MIVIVIMIVTTLVSIQVIMRLLFIVWNWQKQEKERKRGGLWSRFNLHLEQGHPHKITFIIKIWIYETRTTNEEMKSSCVVTGLRTGQLAHLPPVKSSLIRITQLAAVLNVYLFNLLVNAINFTLGKTTRGGARWWRRLFDVSVFRRTACDWYRWCHVRWTYLMNDLHESILRDLRWWWFLCESILWLAFFWRLRNWQLFLVNTKMALL